MNSLLYVLIYISPDDDLLVLKHVAINITNKVVLTVDTHLIIWKHNLMPNFQIGNFISLIKKSTLKTVLKCIKTIYVPCLSLWICWLILSTLFSFSPSAATYSRTCSNSCVRCRIMYTAARLWKEDDIRPSKPWRLLRWIENSFHK